ncbi:MAG: DUF29 domain-containing protein [Cyanobacteriota bacterium]|jgi:hypothetical protein
MSPTLYDADFNQWLEETANSLKSRNFQALDLENLIEEIESMGRSDKREIKTRLIVLLMHLLKQKYQSQKQTTSWIVTINEQRRQIKAVLKDSPSLKPYLQKELRDCYEDARKDAAKETGLPVATFPLECPFTQAQILDPDYFPNA